MEEKTSKRIEIEFRSRFSYKDYKRLNNFLSKHGNFLGSDDKDTYTFILPDKTLRLVRNVSQRGAKLVFKPNKIGKGSHFEEIEIPIQADDIPSYIKIFSNLGFNKIIHSYQKRRNYHYRGIELALKHSREWGYHLELEILISRMNEKPKAVQLIKSLAVELGIRLMTDKEIKQFAKYIEDRYTRHALLL